MGKRSSRSVRVIKSVLHNTLGTFVSRYSDHRGYWLLGQIPLVPDTWAVDLLHPPTAGHGPTDIAKRLAARRFFEQLAKTGFEPDRVSRAVLEWRRGHEVVPGWHGDHRGRGHQVVLTATAQIEGGPQFSRSVTVFIARHDPRRERRRGKEDWGPDMSGTP